MEAVSGPMTTKAVSGPDFSVLPDTVWINVLTILPIRDRSHLALTCCRLRDLFAVPAVWRTAKLGFDAPFHRFGNPVTFLKRVGAFIQHVSLLFRKLDLSPETLTALSHVSCQWKLKTLIINIGPGTVDGFFRNEHESVLQCLAATDLSTLKHLELQVIPATDIINNLAHAGFRSVIKVLSEKVSSLDQLHTLSLGCPIIHLCDPTGLTAHMLTLPPTVTDGLLDLAPCLRHLRLSAFNFTDDVLRQLAARRHLRTLTVDVFAFNSSAQLPMLSAGAWGQLLSACPHLHVSCLVRCTLESRNNRLAALLPPLVPVVNIRVEYNRNQTEFDVLEALQLAREHPDTVHTFVSRISRDDVQCGKELVSMATECTRLRHLEFRGTVLEEHMTQLKRLDRQWASLVIPNVAKE